MQRISTLNRIANLFGPGKDGFKNGDLANGVVPTAFNADWCNGVQEELANVIEASGAALNAGSVVQLLTAIRWITLGRMVNVQVFSASGTYTPSSARVSKIIVEAVGGGGAGGGAAATSSNASAGGGGGAGCYIKALFTAVPASAVVTIGAGGVGAPGVGGGGGGTTSFGALVSVSGGGPGASSGVATNFPVSAPPGSGAGAFSNTGTTISSSPGGAGQWGLVIALAGNALGGMGGASMLGQGATWTGSGGASSTTANAAIGRGAGGSGACNASTGAVHTGGSGAAGMVIVYEFE